jgi:hypothetical protein
MGAIARNAANNITTSGVFTADAITNASVTGITVLANAEDGITLISSQTASASATISFTTGLDSTYKAYKFVLVNCHPATDGAEFTFNLSTDSGSNYNVTKTTTFFVAHHNENGADPLLAYETSRDLAQSTAFQTFSYGIDNDNDSSISGSLTLFSPSSTTYVKHFIANTNIVHNNPTVNYSINSYVAGYGNTTSAVNAVQFKFSSGNIDDGKIYLYGIK